MGCVEESERGVDKHIVLVMKYILKHLKNLSKKFWLSLKVPLKIDVHVTEICNLNCKGCSHFSPLARTEYLDLKKYATSLQHLAKIEKAIGSIQLLGGEPLLNPELTEIIRITRHYLLNTNIHILTNGILLSDDKKLPENFWSVCQENNVIIKITKYPCKVDYDVIEQRCENHNVKYEILGDRGRQGEWAFFPLYKNGFKHWSVKFKFLKLARCSSFNCFQLVGDKIYPCCHVAYIRHFNNYFGENFKVEESDSVDVTKINKSFQVRKLLFTATPFCKYCGKGYIPSSWSHSMKNKEEWLAE